MTYMDVVLKVREGYENSDAREIFEHIAVQVEILGEGAGIFYIEVAERAVCVEPYDYRDRDLLFYADADTLFMMAKGELSVSEAIESGRLHARGSNEKLQLFKKIKLR